MNWWYLAETFRRMYAYYDKTNKTKQKVISSLTYPAITMVVGIIVMIIIMVVAVPSFTKSFTKMGTELPGITLFVMGMSDFFMSYGIILLFAIAAIILACKLYQQTEKGAELFASMALKLLFISPY